MIQLTRLNQVHFYLNPDLIEHIETTPDTVITLTTGPKYLVLEAAHEVVERIVAFRRRLRTLTPLPGVTVPAPVEEISPAGDEHAIDRGSEAED